jgi:membrane protein insertase Oxa1/YidC/SpoIIIJ
MFLVTLFYSFVYQPFLNILVFFYWLNDLITRGHPDMGIAVIFLTIIIRILLLPMSLAEDKSEEERREMYHKLKEIEEKYKADPITMRHESKKLFHRNRKVVAAEMFSFFIQVVIALMLWKMFETGLPGEDIHLIYKFMPHVELPFNLVFLGKYDLSHTNFFLNLIQSLMIFLVETVAITTSPYPPMKGEVVRLQLILPVVSFLVFMAFPAGKKVFVITTLTISFLILLYKYARRRYEDYKATQKEKEKLEEEEHLAKQVQEAGTTQYVKVGDQLYPVQQLQNGSTQSNHSEK